LAECLEKDKICGKILVDMNVFLGYNISLKERGYFYEKDFSTL
jgi:hypothetical protein